MTHNATLSDFQTAGQADFDLENGNDILAKAFTGAEDTLAQANAHNGSALLHYLLATACDNNMRINRIHCTVENITENVKFLNSKKI